MAQVSDKQFDILIGISRKMEQSLAAIEKNSSKGGSEKDTKDTKAGGKLVSLATGVKMIVEALSVKKLNSSAANTVVGFVNHLSVATENIKPENLKNLANFAQSVTGFVGKMGEISVMSLLRIQLMSKILFEGKNSVFSRILHGVDRVVKEFDKDKLEKIILAGKALSALSSSLVILGNAMKTLALVAIISPLVMIGAVTARIVVGMFTFIGSKGDDIKKGGEGIKQLGLGLISLAAGLATMALVSLIIKPTMILGIIAIVALLGITFSLLGKIADKIEAGSKAIGHIGLGLVALGIGIAFLSVVLLLVPAKTILESFLVIAGYTILFALMGRAAGDIAEGALVMILGISLSLFFFAGALFILSKSFDDNGKGATMGLVFIGAAVALFMFMGDMIANIEEGVLAIGTMGAALIAFSVGILVYAWAVKKVMEMFKGKEGAGAFAAGAIILGFSGLFAILGFAALNIALGAASLLLIGASLIVFSVGLIIFSLALKAVYALFNNSTEKVTSGLTAILGGISGAISSLGWNIIPITLGSAAMIMIGAALTVFSIGLLLFSTALDVMMKMGLYDKQQSTFYGVDIVKHIGDQFVALGEHPIKLALGVALGLGLGAALVSISTGLIAASKAIKSIPDAEQGQPSFVDKLFGSKDKPGLIYSIANAFAGFYNDPNISGGGSSPFGGLLGGIRAITGTSPVQLGIKMVAGLGDALQEIAGGIAAFADLQAFPIKKAVNGKLVDDVINLQDAISNIQKGLVGTTPGTGFLMSIAKVFSDVYTTYSGSSDLTKTLDKVGGNGIVGSLIGGLSAITGTDPVTLGIKMVSGIGGALQSIAGGIAAFANFSEFPIKTVVGGKLVDSTVDILGTVIPKIQANLPGLLTKLGEIFADIGKKYPNGFFSGNNDAKRGADTIKQIGDSLSSITGGIVAWAEMQSKGIPTSFDKDGKAIGFTPFNLDTIEDNITEIVMFIPGVFTDTLTSTGMDTKLDAAQENAEKIKSLGDVVKGLAESASKISDAYKGPKGKEQTPFASFTTDFGKFLSYLAANPIQKATIDSLNALAAAFKGFADISSPFKDFTAAFKEFDTSMVSFTKAIPKLAANMPQFSKFSMLLGNHANNGAKFTVWESAFSKMSSTDLANFSKNFKVMDTNAINAFKIWTEALGNFVKIDPNTFKTIAQQLEGVIGSPLAVQDKLDRAAANNTTPNTSTAPALQQPTAAATTQGVVDRHNAATAGKTPDDVKGGKHQGATSADIQAMQQAIAQMSQQIESLVSVFQNPQGLKVHMF